MVLSTYGMSHEELKKMVDIINPKPKKARRHVQSNN